MIEIKLPFPDKKLSSNARLHWKAKLSAKAIARNVGYFACYEMMTEGRNNIIDSLADKKLAIFIKVHAPNNRRHDILNVGDNLKYYIDGICEALGIDDYIFDIAIIYRGKVDAPKGKVIIRICEDKSIELRDEIRESEQWRQNI